MSNLTSAIHRGGRALLVRQIVGLVVGLIGIFAITRLIGPADYGAYAAAFGIIFYAQMLAELSLDVYLVRHESVVSKRFADEVFTLLMLLGVLAVVVLEVASPAIAVMVNIEALEAVTAAMAGGIILMHLQQVPLSLMERELDYRSIGIVEMLGQIAFVVVAIGVAIVDPSVWAPVAGWYVQQAVLALGYWTRSTYSPRPTWPRRDMTGHLRAGIQATAGTAAYSARNLVPPLVVGSSLGATQLGYLALAIRLVDQAGFARQIIQRLSYAVTGKVASDNRRLREAVTRGMEAQVLATGLPLIVFSCGASLAIPLIFGPEWEEAAKVAPLLVPGFIASAVMAIPGAVVIGHPKRWLLIAVNALNATLLFGLAWLLTPHLGLLGYAVADGVAVLSWLFLIILYPSIAPPPRYLFSGAWWLGISLICVGIVANWALVLCGTLLLLNPFSLKHLWHSGIGLLRGAGG